MWLRMKITAALAALIALPLVAGFATLYFAGHFVLQSTTDSDLNADTAAATQAIEDRLSLTFADMKAWSAMPVMQDVLLGDNGGEIKRVVGELRRVYPEFAQLIVTDARGLVVAATDGADKTQDMSGEEGFRAATTGRSYQSAASTGSMTASPTISFTVPVVANYDRQSVVGTMTGVLDLKALIKSAISTTRFAGKGRSLMIERNGVLIYSSNASNGLIHAVRGAHNYRARGTHEISWNDLSYVAMSVPTTGAKLLSDPGFTIVGIVPTATAFVAIGRLSTIVGSVVVLSLLIVFYLAWRWTTPLIQLSGAMERLAQGDTGSRLPDVAWERTFGPMVRALETFRHTRIVRDKLAAREKDIDRVKEAAETALKAKSEHLASLSRALKTELTTIVELSDAINREALKEVASGNANLERIANLKEISRSGVQLLGVINDLFDLSEAEAGHASLDEACVDLGALVGESVELMRGAAEMGGIALSFQAADPTVYTCIDAYKFKQIMFNLLSNAVKFTPEGGSVIATVHVDGSGRPTINIIDTGIGMPTQLSPMAFSSSHEHGRHGAGLGLPLVRQLVDLHGGAVEIESEAGKGTTVSVSLPATRVVERPAYVPADALEEAMMAEAAPVADAETASAEVAA